MGVQIGQVKMNCTGGCSPDGKTPVKQLKRTKTNRTTWTYFYFVIMRKDLDIILLIAADLIESDITHKTLQSHILNVPSYIPGEENRR